MLRLLLTSLAAAPLLASAAPPRIADPVVLVPIDHSSGHIGIAVKVNGQGPFHFQLDTGSGHEVSLDVTLAAELGLEKIGEVDNNDGSGINTARCDLFGLDSVELAGVRFEDVEANAFDYSWIQHPGKTPVRGLLGFPLFREMLLTIDYPESTLELTEGRMSRAGKRNIITYRTQGGTPHIRMRIGKRMINAVLDTGHQGTLTLPGSMAPSIGTAEAPVFVGRARTVNNRFDIYAADLTEPLLLAGHRFEAVDVHFMAEYDYGLLGHGLLSQFVITFDQKKKLVHFARAEETR